MTRVSALSGTGLMEPPRLGRPARRGATHLVASAGIVVLSTIDPDVDRALTAVRARATGGDVVAQFSLGSVLYYGDGDVAESVDWLRRAAAQKHAPAEFHLGQLHDFGFGVAQDTAEAIAWYRTARWL